MKFTSFLLALCLTFGYSSTAAFAQTESATIIFIYDASGSMWGKIGAEAKMQIARRVLSETVNQLASEQAIGLVAYGHRREGDCEDVEFLVDATNTSKEAVKTELATIKPVGRTPLAASALLVIESLKASSQKATIILLTDGVESCGGNLCEVVQAAREAGVNFKLHIVGFGIADDELDNLKCAAQAGSGQYFAAGDATELGSVLTEATAATVEATTENLAILTTLNGEAIDSWVKVFQSGTDIEAGGTRTYRDTGFVALAPGNYDLYVQPLENSDVNTQTIKEVEVAEEGLTFREVNFDAGSIQVETTMNEAFWDCTIGITNTADAKRVGGGRSYGRVQVYEVSPGTYDIKLEALRIRGDETKKTLMAIAVSAGDTTVVRHNFATGTARIGALGNDGLMDATINIVNQATGRSVGGARTYTSANSNPKEFLLNPGNYSVTMVGVREFKGEKRSFEMTITQGGTVEKMVQF